jgi:hypothetical protein
LNGGSAVWFGVRRCFSAAFVSPFSSASRSKQNRKTKAAEKHCRTPDQTDPQSIPTVEVAAFTRMRVSPTGVLAKAATVA